MASSFEAKVARQASWLSNSSVLKLTLFKNCSGEIMFRQGDMSSSIDYLLFWIAGLIIWQIDSPYQARILVDQYNVWMCE